MSVLDIHGRDRTHLGPLGTVVVATIAIASGVLVAKGLVHVLPRPDLRRRR